MMRAQYSNLVDECRQMVASHLLPRFSNLFENADVVLLEFAEKAESNAAQQRFFEAMKEIQVKRAAIQQVFFDELQQCFRRFRDSSLSGVTTYGIQVTEEDSAQFSLVDKETVEETVAMQNMTTKAQLNYANEIHALRQRLALLVGGRKLDEQEIPGGPRQLAECYREAVRQLSLEPKIKIVIFLLFDKFVMSQLLDLYQEYNSRLVVAGLLPNLKYEIRKAPNTGVAHKREQRGAVAAGAGAAPGAGNAAQQTVGEEMFDAICQLLAKRRPSQGRAEAAPGSSQHEVLSRPMLVSTIDQMQKADHSSVISRETLDEQLIPDIELDTRLIDNIKLTLVQQREKLFGGVDRRRVASADADVIDLVGMIFEYMLNDDAIPNAVKALLSRLHTPFLKVAILDKQFFTNDDHPVRQLLNTMIDAGARYVVETDLKRGIFPYMRLAVNRVLDEFDDKLAVFAEVLAEFQERLEQMRHTAEITEQRSREAASGQERLQQARERSRAVIGSAMDGKRLLMAIDQLLRQAWADKLMFILLRDREGERGDSWQLAIRLMDDIIETTRYHADPAMRQALRQRLPDIQSGLREGLRKLASFGNDDIEHLLTLISDSQFTALEQPWGESQDVVTPAAAPEAPARVGREAVPSASRSPREETIQQLLDDLEFGAWFEFSVAEGVPRQRLKLAWFTQVAGHYMFVDKLGVKAAVKTRSELADDLLAGRARVLQQEKQPFVDRAMDAVRKLLRRGEKISA